MKKISRFLAKASLVAGSFFVVQSSNALHMSCTPSGYDIVLDNPSYHGGDYRLSCTDGYHREDITLYVAPHGTHRFSGRLHGHITCHVSGTYTVSVAQYCH